MAAQRGRDLLIKLANGAGGFDTVAGLRTRTLAFNAETIDITNAESAGQWRELLSGAGVRRAALSGSGIFKDAASDSRMRAVFFDGLVAVLQITIPDFGIVEGPFQIASLEYRADFSGEVTFDMALESAGAVSFSAV